MLRTLRFSDRAHGENSPPQGTLPRGQSHLRDPWTSPPHLISSLTPGKMTIWVNVRLGSYPCPAVAHALYTIIQCSKQPEDGDPHAHLTGKEPEADRVREP